MKPVGGAKVGYKQGTGTRSARAAQLCHTQAAALTPSTPKPACLWGNSLQSRLRKVAHRAAVAEPLTGAPEETKTELPGNAPPRVLIAGAGIGGLVLAVALLRKGFDVQIYERDLTAVRGEGKYRGPIQVQSNALAALEAIDPLVAEQLMAAGCITGDRINGLCDGVTGKWYVKFDTFHPAVDRGLPVTRVISRHTIQELLAEAVQRLGGETVLHNDCHVVDFAEGANDAGARKVWAVLEDGRRMEGDVLVGADGIWSKVRRKMVGPTEASYSQYTCYTGIADFTPPDIDTVGYRVFLGNGKYFVSSDVGNGKMQWYGFHKEPAGGKDAAGRKKERLLDIFGHWTDMVTDLIKATPEEDVMRRDIFDRPPIFTWAKGRVALLGDSAHAMQPNLGQGGCMAIEDGYQLATDLAEAVEAANGASVDYEAVLKGYQSKRLVRASAIHGLAGMAAIMASTYKAYLGEGLGPLSWIQKFKIPHPGRVGGYFAMNLAMPTMLSWVLGGNVSAFESTDRRPQCRINDKPKAFNEKDFPLFMADDDALLRAARARWMLVPSAPPSEVRDPQLPALCASDSMDELCLDRVAIPEGSVSISDDGLVVGRGPSSAIVLDTPSVSERHAVLEKRGSDYYVTQLAADRDTWLNERRLSRNTPTKVAPGDQLEFGKQGCLQHRFSIKMCHISLFHESLLASSIEQHPGQGIPDAQVA